jgi:hypothetical protein
VIYIGNERISISKSFGVKKKMAKTETIVARRKAAKKAARSKTRSSGFVKSILDYKDYEQVMDDLHATKAEFRDLQQQLSTVGSKLDRLLRRG